MLLLVWQRTKGRTSTATVTSVLGVLGLSSVMVERLQDTIAFLCAEYWPYVLLYLFVFGLGGYAYTFWRLEGGRPKPYECSLLAQATLTLTLTLTLP